MALSTKFAIDGIIFDLGSTLIEYENISWDQLNLQCIQSGYSYLKDSGFSVPDLDLFFDRYISVRDDFRSYSRATLREWDIRDAINQHLLSIGINDGNDIADHFFDAYYQRVAGQLTIFDDTAAVLGKLKDRGLRIGLVSNTIFPETYHKKELHGFGIDKYFDFTLFSSSFGFRKPHPSIYERAVKLMSREKERILFVGDRYIEDYVGPREFGLRAILKFREGRDYPIDAQDGPIIMNTLTEIFHYLAL